MKPILLSLLIPLASLAQKEPCSKHLQIGAGITGGISVTKHVPVGEMFIGAKISPKIIFYPVSIKIHGAMSDPTMPVIFESRAAYKIGNFEPYVAYGRHFAGSDGKECYAKYSGWKPGCGVIFHFRNLVFTSAISGNIVTFQVGFFGVR
jgi:hypothetical protein